MGRSFFKILNQTNMTRIKDRTKTLRKDTDLVTVCNQCLSASCWQGVMYCSSYKSAGTIRKTVGELKWLNVEHESYFIYEKH